MRVIGDDFAIREGPKTPNECRHSFGGHIDAVFRNALERLVGRSGRVPIQLHIHAAGPLADDISPDRIVKWADECFEAEDLTCSQLPSF
jgi:hypothetical protein